MTTSGPYRTSGDLINRVLQKLGVLSAGQAVDPEDYSTVADNLDSYIRTFASLEICYAPDANNIPGDMFEPLASIIAHLATPDFGSNDSDRIMLAGAGLGGPPSQVPFLAGSAVLALKIMRRGRPTYEPLRTESF